jgi:hypothetical protein
MEKWNGAPMFVNRCIYLLSLMIRPGLYSNAAMVNHDKGAAYYNKCEMAREIELNHQE